MFVIYENVITSLKEFVSNYRKSYGTSNVCYKLVSRQEMDVYFNLNVRVQPDTVMKMEFKYNKEQHVLTLYKCKYVYIDNTIESAIEELNNMTIEDNHVSNLINGVSTLSIK